MSLKIVKEPTLKEKTAQKFEKLWQTDPGQFDPERNCLERERLQRTLSLMPTGNRQVADLGCGSGYFSRKLSELGAAVDAIDIAATPLKALSSENIRTSQHCLPRTTLEDERYDLVLCTDLIAYMPENEFRLLFSEIARIIKPAGTLICSTSLDTRTEDALQRFASLAESEFTLENWIVSHHLFYLHVKDFFAAPSRFVRARNNSEYREQQLNVRSGFCKAWFRLNSHPIPALVWTPVQWLANPIVNLIRQSRPLLITLEKLCRFLLPDSGITHAIISAHRRKLEDIPEEEQPVERKSKREIWE